MTLKRQYNLENTVVTFTAAPLSVSACSTESEQVQNLTDCVIILTCII